MKSIITTLFLTVFLSATHHAQHLPGNIAPDFNFLDLQGNEHNLYHALDQGYIVLLDFFYVDCPPCVEAAPEIEAIHQDYQGKNVLVWSISDRDSDSHIEKYQTTLQLTNTVGGEDGGGYEVINLYASNYTFVGFPTISVICPDKLLNWDIFPYSTGAPEWRTAIESCGVIDATQEYVPLNSVTSLETVESPSLKAFISPNPVGAFANLNLKLQSTALIEINAINALGQSIPIQTYLELKSGVHKLELMINQLQQGIYFLEIKSNGKVLEVLKFIKI